MADYVVIAPNFFINGEKFPNLTGIKKGEPTQKAPIKRSNPPFVKLQSPPECEFCFIAYGEK